MAFALLWAPVALQSGAAMAMAPPDHDGRMIAQGHCDESGAGDESDPHAGMPCCAGMGIALEANLTPSIVEPGTVPGTPERPAIGQDGASYLAELPTPPPRRG